MINIKGLLSELEPNVQGVQELLCDKINNMRYACDDYYSGGLDIAVCEMHLSHLLDFRCCQVKVSTIMEALRLAQVYLTYRAKSGESEWQDSDEYAVNENGGYDRMREIAPIEDTFPYRLIAFLQRCSQNIQHLDEYSIENNEIIVKPKYNKELLEGVANLQNDELNEIVRMFYKHRATAVDKEAANASLAKILEVNREALEDGIEKKKVDILFGFANTRYIRHSKGDQRKATTQELQIFFDYGLALVRLAYNLSKK